MKDLIIVDGYNFIFNCYQVGATSSEMLSYLRERLIRDLSQYKNYINCNLIVVFDAKNSDNPIRSIEKVNNIEVIYSKGGETADTIVEEIVHKQQNFNRIFVVTSDYVQQKVVFKKNIYRKSVREFKIELGNFKKELKDKIELEKKAAEKKLYQIEKRLDKKTKEKFSKFIK